MFEKFINALTFLTIIRIKQKNFDANGSLLFFPVVGLLIGLSVYLVGLISLKLAPLMMLIFSVVITGGLHLDGLADTADAYFSHKNKDEMLTIMKDSRIGVMGALALILIIMSKFYSFKILNNPFAIILPFAYSRGSMILLIEGLPYLRNNGTAKAFFDSSGKDNKILFYFTVVLSTFVGLKFFISFNLMFLITFLMLKRLHLNKVGGITGDIIGATCEVIETLLLLTGAIIG
ncbi:adenosylcobinamide-GDP ribazoletransferase [Deferribacteraceae bacterium V6Fe1]|nr:adenosylcobinamide-GDP ribazoletransferase [Deferribacteraceae bacterium V6Fe1]